MDVDRPERCCGIEKMILDGTTMGWYDDNDSFDDDDDDD